MIWMACDVRGIICTVTRVMMMTCVPVGDVQADLDCVSSCVVLYRVDR